VIAPHRHAAALPPPPLAAERRLLLLGAPGVLGLAYTTGAVLGASDEVLGGLFVALVALVPSLGWWAFARIGPPLRRLCGSLALAGTLWLGGTLVWSGYFLANGRQPPSALGPWDVIFAVAYLLGIGAVVVELRSTISLRHAALDASVVLAGAVAVVLALSGSDLESAAPTDWAGTLVRPVFGIVMLVLVVSAVLGAWSGVPLSVAFVGAAQAFLALGGLVYTYDVVGNHSADLRWAGLGLTAGAVLSTAAASVIILGLDRPLRLRTARIPDHPLGAKAVLFLALGALTATVGVALYGQASDNDLLFTVGLLASVWVGGAMVFRARNSIREVERAYAELERAHLALERIKDELGETNLELAAANVQLRAAKAAFDELLVVADERTSGELRALIEETGEDLAAFLSRDPPSES
jgi:hypothetical protein